MVIIGKPLYDPLGDHYDFLVTQVICKESNKLFEPLEFADVIIGTILLGKFREMNADKYKSWLV
jgi:hypothetical protein